MIERCFEFDWEMCKIPRIIKDSQQLSEIKAFLKKNYKMLREIYKYYAAVSPAGNVFSIGNNVLSDIISNMGDLVDGSTIKLADIDLEFVSTNAGLKKNSNMNPERFLVRFQIMEIFTRIALTKYWKKGEVANPIDAVKKMFSQYITPFGKGFNCHTWRRTVLWNEKCDHVFKRYLKSIKGMYDKFSGRFATPSSPNFMSLDEFFDVICQSGVVDETFGQREI